MEPIIQSGWSYIRDSSSFTNTVKSLKNISSSSTILVTADAVGLHLTIPHE